MATDVAVLAMKFQTTGAASTLRTLDGLKDGSIKAEKATDSLTGAVKSSGRQFKVNNQFVQQAGFQVGDFATQVASGQSALVAFTQQFSQLAGFLGPSGPVLGAIVAIGGAIAVGLSNAFSDAEGEASDLIDRIRDVADSVDQLTDAQVRALKADFFIQNQERLQNIIKERQRISELNGEIERLEALIASPSAQRTDVANNRFLTTDVQGVQKQTDSVDGLRKRLSELRTELDNSQASVDTYFQESQKLGDEIDELISGSKDERDAISDARKEIDRLNESLAFQVATYGQSERAIKLAEIAQLEKNGADQEAVANAISLTNALFDQIEAQKKSEELARQADARERQRTKLISELDPLQAERDRFANQLALIDEFNFSKEQRRELELEAERQHAQALVRISENQQRQQAQGLQLFTDSQSQQLGAIGSIFGNMAELSKQAGRDQFEAWKIFASAQAAVNTALAISNALTVQPAPLGIALAGTIGALGVVQQATIQATEYQGSFEGGGFTGSGSRTGGIDGRGGFPAILHPNETVLDHTQGQGIGGDVTVIINNAPPGTTARESTDENGNRFINIFLADMANGGPMSRSMQSTFGVRRKGR